MITAQDLANQDLAQGIAATIRQAFGATDNDDLTAQAWFDTITGAWMVRHWHDGVRFDLTLIEVGRTPYAWCDGAELASIGPITADDTPQSVAARFLLVAHGGIETTGAVIDASRQAELHADLTGHGCTCPKAPCGGAIVASSGGSCPEHDAGHAGVWHWNTACPGIPAG